MMVLLTKIATDLRRTLDEQCRQGRLIGELSAFPTGCCGFVTNVLGNFLVQQGIEAKYIQGADGAGRTHAWLEVDGVVVDLTGDQFPGRPPVFVGALDAWFAKWKQDPSAGLTPVSSTAEKQIKALLDEHEIRWV